jgi:hypothetical protein
VRVSDWRMRSFGPLLRTHPEVPRENAITVGAFVAIRQVGPTRRVGGGYLAARIAPRARPYRFMSSHLDCALRIANLEVPAIVPRY